MGGLNRPIHAIIDALLVVVMVLYITVAPYTKVEESFNMQASHDLIYHGYVVQDVFNGTQSPSREVLGQSYDHLLFPGVVPRSFGGVLLLTLPAKAVVSAGKSLELAIGWSRAAWIPNDAIVSQPFLHALDETLDSVQSFGHWLSSYRPVGLYVTRFFLGLLSIGTFMLLRESVWMFIVRPWLLTRASQTITASQELSHKLRFRAFASGALLCSFHLMFYASRLLPNVLALCVCNAALSYFIAGISLCNYHADEKTSLAQKSASEFSKCVVLLCVSFVFFRCDTLVLAFPMVLAIAGGTGALSYKSPTVWHNAVVSFLRRGNPNSGLQKAVCTLLHFLIVGVGSIAVSLAVSFVIDSYYWQKPVIPEMVVLIYNAVENQSHNWGVSPVHFYFTSCLPRMLVALLPFLGAAVLWPKSRSWRMLCLPETVTLFVCVAFVLSYSLLPHKELRFLFPAGPTFICLCAVGIFKADLWIRGVSCSAWRRTIATLLWLSVYGACACVTLLAAFVSAHNYPGGHAMQLVRELPADSHVHIGNLAAISGVSRFWQRSDIAYSKTEHLSPKQLCEGPYNALLSQIGPYEEGDDNISCAEHPFRLSGVTFGFERLHVAVQDVNTSEPSIQHSSSHLGGILETQHGLTACRRLDQQYWQASAVHMVGSHVGFVQNATQQQLCAEEHSLCLSVWKGKFACVSVQLKPQIFTYSRESQA